VVPAADLALAERLSAFWQVFMGAGVAGFAASLAVLNRRAFTA
jgi:hypothetical protein